MKAVVQGVASVRDPLSGEIVTIDLPAFYSKPPESLAVLFPTKFEKGSFEKSIKNSKGESLTFRNYSNGKAIAWNNNEWKVFVPSADGKDPGYMTEADRIIKYSFGTSKVFNLTTMFVH